MDWANTIIYQIYPLSFQDSNNDGKGDLKGIIKRLPHLNELGIPAIWVGPLYKTGWVDVGYDVIDHTAIDPTFGTLQDALDLIHEAHKLNIKVIFDFIPNHTSDQHPWFLESRSDKFSPKRNWYTWKSASNDGTEPNNWIAVFGGSAWTFDAQTGQYYLHTFYQQQPDLNLSNPETRKAVYSIMKFWFDRGVDGFRIDAIAHIAKDPELKNNPINPYFNPTVDDPSDIQLHQYDKFLPERFTYINEMIQIMSNYPGSFLMSESYAGIKVIEDVLKHTDNGKHSPTNFELINLPWSVKEYFAYIKKYLNICKRYNAIPNWTLSNHDRQRVASRVGSQRARLLAVLQMMLPGISCMYYGDEIGMIAPLISQELKKDHYAFIDRDAQRTPMQWDDSDNAGFSSEKPWLPVHEKYSHNNVEIQKIDDSSMLNLYKKLIEIKLNDNCCKLGETKLNYTNVKELLHFSRQYDGESLEVYCNFNDFEINITIQTTEMDLILSTYSRTLTANQNKITLRPYEAVVIKQS